MNQLVALVFDLDQTLFDRRQAMTLFLASLSLSEQQQQHIMHVDQNGYGHREKFFREFESVTGHHLDQETLVRSLLQFAQFETEILQILQHLKARFSMAILTNGSSSSQRAKIKALGLEQIFSTHQIFISSEMGVAKPNQRAFDGVTNALDVSGCDCVYFGDQLETDVIAAQKSGWQAHLVQGPTEVIRWLRWLTESVF